MTKKILTAAALRDWDTPETKAVYWSGASLDCDWDRLSPEQRAWYSMGAADALTDVFARKAGLLR